MPHHPSGRTSAPSSPIAALRRLTPRIEGYGAGVGFLALAWVAGLGSKASRAAMPQLPSAFESMLVLLSFLFASAGCLLLINGGRLFRDGEATDGADTQARAARLATSPVDGRTQMAAMLILRAEQARADTARQAADAGAHASCARCRRHVTSGHDCTPRLHPYRRFRQPGDAAHRAPRARGGGL